MKGNKGITLIALVVTIIVLIILAGISIQLVLGENGILKKANKATKDYTHATVKEAVMLKIAEYEEERATGEREKDNFDSLVEDGIIIPIGEVKKEEIDIPTGKKDEIINRIGIVYVEALTGQELKYGNGDGYEIGGNKFIFEDVYVIHLNSMNHFGENHLYYYNKETTADLGEITDSEERIDLGEIEDLIKEANVEDLFAVDSEGTIYLKDLRTYYWSRGQLLPIQNLVIPKEIDGIEVKKIGNELLFETKNEIQTVYIPDTVTTIGNQAFSHTYVKIPLKKVRMSPNILTIEWQAFWNCKLLEEIQLPEGLKTIESNAFSKCTSLKELQIPESVEVMQNNVFQEWNENQTIKVPFKEGELPTGWDSNWNRNCDAKIEYLK